MVVIHDILLLFFWGVGSLFIGFMGVFILFVVWSIVVYIVRCKHGKKR